MSTNTMTSKLSIRPIPFAQSKKMRMKWRAKVFVCGKSYRANSKLRTVIPHPPQVFKAGQKELAQDLILKEQQIEYLISGLPGLENSERDQEEMIKQLEEELKVAEEERKQALKEKEVVLEQLESVIRNVKRP